MGVQPKSIARPGVVMTSSSSLPSGTPLPADALAELLHTKDWRLRGRRLSELFDEHETDAWGWRAAALRQVSEVLGQHPTGVHNLLAVTRWLLEHFPRGLDAARPSYSFGAATALRTLWRKDPDTAALIADEVFKGGFGPGRIRDAAGWAARMDRLELSDETARRETGHAELEIRGLRTAVRAGVHAWAAAEGEAAVHDPREEGLSQGPWDFVVRRPDGPRVLVHLALLPTPTGDTAAMDVAARTAMMTRFGRAAVVISSGRRSLAEEVRKFLSAWGIEDAVILLARPEGTKQIKVEALPM